MKNEPKVSITQASLLHLFLWTTIFYFVGYVVVGGTNWGFPRYHVVILPLVCTFVGYYVSNMASKMRREEGMIVSFCLLTLIVSISLLNDPLLFINLRFKEMLLYGGSHRTIMREFVMTFLPYYGLPIIFGLILSRFLKSFSMVVLCLYIGALTTMVSLDMQQAFAAYRTSAQYGAEGKVKVLEEVRKDVKKGNYVVATPEFRYDLKDRELSGIGWKAWKSEDVLYQSIKSNNPEAIIAGLTVNTYAQLRWLRSDEIQLFLSKNYRFNRIGTYYLWLRSYKSAM